MKRPCLTCGTLTTGTRCPAHQRQLQHQYQHRHDARRGSTTARGYGTQHQLARQAQSATLPTVCGYCGVLIIDGDQWDAAHVEDGRPEMGYMVAHPQCNQRAKGGR